MRSADEILDAYCERLLFYMKIGVNSWNLGQQVTHGVQPGPVQLVPPG